jgi:peroxiredoxin
LIALSPERPLEVKKTKQKNNLDFTLVSDEGNKLAKKLNLTFKVEPAVAEEYKALGIDLEASQGNKSYELPMPATFVINQDRKIVYVFADADYTKRASTEEIIQAVKKAAK